jgi:hypothetical protein
VNTAKSSIQKLLVLVGNSVTLIGCAALVLFVTGLVGTEWIARDFASGVRVASSIAIGGCLLSATGYGMADYLEK